MALGRVADATIVRSETEQSASARACIRFWPTARDVTLEAFDWHFARRTVRFLEFAPMMVNPTPTARLALQPWSFAYQRRGDAIAIRRLIPADGVARPVEYELGAWFEPETDDHTALIFAAEPVAAVVYTKRLTDATRYPPSFADTAAWRLAMDIATGQPKSRELRADAEKAWLAALSEARLSAARQQWRATPESELILARA